MKEIIEQLNEKQKQAVLVKDGPVLILAGAGSGKTRVLTSRIAYLVKEKNIHPASILAITFTNKAAKEMRTRAEQLMDNRVYFSWIGTFHSMCVRMLRMYCEITIGYNKNFVIYDSVDQKVLVKDCLKQLNIDEKIYPPKMITYNISQAKNELIDAKSFSKKYEDDYQMSEIAKVYTLYQEKLIANNAMDFDDLIFNTVKMLEKNENVRSYFQNSFKYILIDEYQDTNTTQYKLAKILANKHNNIFVVGDDDQSIYGWRGANIQNILNFEYDFKGCTTIKLERNYRSTSNILNAANAVIKNNINRKGKQLWTNKGDGEKIIYYKANNEYNEALFVATEIQKNIAKGREYEDLAILYRTNAQSRVIEKVLLSKNIPYRIYGGLSFYSRKEVKDVLAYFKLILNVNDNLQFKRIVNEPKRGIGKTTLNRLEEISFNKDNSMYEIAKSANAYQKLNSAKEKLIRFTNIIESLKEYALDHTLEQLYEKLMEETEIIGKYNLEATIESRSRIENIKELKSAIVLFEEDFIEENGENPKLEDFVASVTLATDQDNSEKQTEVTIMTLHAAKGLEFPVVFITGMEEGLFPGQMSYESKSKLEEERRLCYVGITRAKDKLYLLNAEQRTIYGKTQSLESSTFLKEIPTQYLDSTNNKKKPDKIQYNNKKNVMPISIQRGTKPINIAGFKATKGDVIDVIKGDRILHKKYGEGTISNVIGIGDDKMFEIDFDMVGKKRFMAAFTKLKKI